MEIGFDLDGVLADQTALKVEKFKELFSLELERWQVSSNVIDIYVPDRNIRREVGSISGTSAHSSFVEPDTPQYLDRLVQDGHNLHLISRRGKSKQGVHGGLDIINRLALKTFFGERVYFCVTDDEKIEAVHDTGCTLYVDDRNEVVDKLANKIACPILYDHFDLVARGYVRADAGVFVIKSLASIPEICRQC